MLETITRLARTAEDIAQGARLARMYHRDITPVDVARVLDQVKVRYVLVGAHAANGYTGRPRTTVDVDVIVEHPQKACDALLKAFPHLTAQDLPVVIRLKREDGEEAIDLMKPLAPPLWKQLIKIAVPIDIDGERVMVPPVEGVLAAKLGALVSLHRKIPDKMVDGADFIRIVEANPKIDETLLEQLGELVFPGGGKEILQHLADARAGKALKV